MSCPHVQGQGICGNCMNQNAQAYQMQQLGLQGQSNLNLQASLGQISLPPTITELNKLIDNAHDKIKMIQDAELKRECLLTAKSMMAEERAGLEAKHAEEIMKLEKKETEFYERLLNERQ